MLVGPLFGFLLFWPIRPKYLLVVWRSWIFLEDVPAKQWINQHALKSPAANPRSSKLLIGSQRQTIRATSDHGRLGMERKQWGPPVHMVERNGTPYGALESWLNQKHQRNWTAGRLDPYITIASGKIMYRQSLNKIPSSFFFGIQESWYSLFNTLLGACWFLSSLGNIRGNKGTEAMIEFLRRPRCDGGQ